MNSITVCIAKLEPMMRVAIVIVVALLGAAPASAGEAEWKEHMQAGTAAFQRGDFAAASPRWEAALKEAEQFGPDDARLATTLNSLGDVYREQGRYADAESLLRRALAIREKVLGPEHAAVAVTLSSLGELHRLQGRNKESETQFQRALAIREKLLGPEHAAVAATLNGLAVLYRAQRRYAEAEPLFQRALAIREKTLGPEHAFVATTLNGLAVLYRIQGNNAEAEALFQRALAIREKTLGPEHPALATTLHSLADLHREQNRYAEAEPLYQRALAIREKVLGPEHPDVAGTRNTLAGMYRLQNRDAEAEALYRQVLAIRKQAPGTASAPTEAELEAAIGKSLSSDRMRELQAQVRAEPPKTTDRYELAVFYHKRGQANAAIGNYARAIEDMRMALDNILPSKIVYDGWGDRTRVQGELALIYRAHGNFLAAIELWNSMALEYRTQPFTYHWVQCDLMSLYNAIGRWAEADKARLEVEATLPRLRNERNWQTAGYGALALNNQSMARFFITRGNMREGERRFREALEWVEKDVDLKRRTSPKGHLSIRSTSLHLAYIRRALADVLASQGKYGEAETFARAGLINELEWTGFNTLGVTHGLSSIGWARFQQGDIAGAEKYRRYALAALEGSGVVLHSVDLAHHRANLAEAYVVQNRWDDALKLFEQRDWGLRSDAVQFKRTGSNHSSWAYTLHKSGRSPRAADMAKGMAAGQLKRPVVNRWYVAQLRGVEGMALAASGRTAEALQAYRQSIPDLVRRYQDDATDENPGYWRTFWQRVILDGYLELLAKLHASGSAPADLDLVEESFWIADVARASGVQEAITATAARAQLPDKSLVELSRKEQDGLNRIVALNRILSGLAGSTDGGTPKILAEMRAEIERLRKEHATLRSDIQKRHPEYAELIDPKPASVSDVRKALAPGEALVSIYLGESQSYVWTIGTEGKATWRVVPIKREEIENDVRELRKAVDFGEGTVAQLRPFDLTRAHKVYRAFFEPDEALWKDAQILNVIPHGALGELPFSLLVTAPAPQLPAGAQSAYADVPWLMRKAAIAQLPSASAFAALRRTPPAKAQRQPFVGFGDPLFTADTGAAVRRGLVRNLTVQKVADVTEAQLSAMSKSKGPQSGVVLTTRTLAQAFGQLSALPDTADELREIAATLKADPARDLFLNRQATEKNVKQAGLDNRRVVAFATHGIAPGELSGLDQPALVLANPTLTGDTDNDGFLTMEEVLGLKLDADWVVLSACNTGSADGRGSEAVSGLGRAFFYAGARSLLVSNWAVETTSARLLTTELFKRQAENPQLTRAEALRQSMLSLMGKNATGAATFSYAHPAFWAPFSLVGDGGR